MTLNLTLYIVIIVIIYGMTFIASERTKFKNIKVYKHYCIKTPKYV